MAKQSKDRDIAEVMRELRELRAKDKGRAVRTEPRQRWGLRHVPTTTTSPSSPPEMSQRLFKEMLPDEA